MPPNQELVVATSMSYADTVKFSEAYVLQDGSRIYNEMLGVFSAKLAAMRESRERMLKENKRRSVVVSYSLEPEETFELTRAYAQYSLVFKHSERVSGAMARSAIQLTIERLFDRMRGKSSNAVAYDTGLPSIVMHNRDHVHLCVPRENAMAASQLVREDRTIVAVLNSANEKGTPLPMMNSYVNDGLNKNFCGDPVSCKVNAPVGVMNLTGTDTNYLQVCCWMRQHGVKLAYISFVTSKCMEFAYDGDIPELNAHVKNEGDVYHLIYKDSVGMGRTFRRSNHLSLIAKTYERVGENTFVKEFCDRQLAISTYKITMSQGEFPAEDVEYRSWYDASSRNSYLINAYELRNAFSAVDDPRSYELRPFAHPKEEVDKLVAYARRLDTKEFTPQVIMERLRTDITTSVHGGYTIKNRVRRMSDSQFVSLCLAVYARVFAERYYRPRTDKYVQGEVNKLVKTASAGTVSLVTTHVRMMYEAGYTVTVDRLMARVRRFVGWWKTGDRIPLPTISQGSPFEKYGDSMKPKSWLDKKDWRDLLGNTWEQFCPYLPGFETSVFGSASANSVLCYSSDIIKELADALEDSSCDSSTLVSFDESSTDCGTRALVAPKVQGRKPVADCDDVREIVSKVTDCTQELVDLTPPSLTETEVVMSRSSYQDAHAGLMANPLPVIQDAIGRIFPGCTLMNTSMVGADVHYGGFDIVAKAVKIKITTAKLKPLRPELLYTPQMGTQVLPNVKQTMPAMLPTVVKRNLNSTSSVDPLHLGRMWDRTWGFMKQAYYVDNVDDIISGWDYIGPTAQLVAEWASKLDPQNRHVLATLDFDASTLDVALQESNLMLKGKRKPNLGPSFASAVKAAQSIQYDGTKRRTAFFSPLFAEKVRRDKAVLRDDVIIMQSKSPADLNERLSCFDWRPTSKGPLKYLMLDGEMFDKSQVLSTLEMHWKKSEKFKILPDYVETLRQNTAYRKAGSQEAGIQVFLTPQRGSGDSDTLDGNCDVSQAAYARFFARYRSQIEFILIMGDDVTVAFRGDVDITYLESECMSEFNLSVKATVSEYGNFVSGWLVHLPDGSIKWVTDPMKRAVALGDRSVSALTNFDEKYEAFKDQCKGLEGYATQQFLARAMTVSYSRDLGMKLEITDVADVIKGVVSVAASKDEYRKFFSKTPDKYSY